MPAPQQHPAMASRPTPSSHEVDIGLVCLLLLLVDCEGMHYRSGSRKSTIAKHIQRWQRLLG